jgi:hypothetical protein
MAFDREEIGEEAAGQHDDGPAWSNECQFRQAREALRVRRDQIDKQDPPMRWPPGKIGILKRLPSGGRKRRG